MTCQEFFEHVVSRIADTCSGYVLCFRLPQNAKASFVLFSSGTQLIVVASADDATLCPCYPTPPIRMAQPFDKVSQCRRLMEGRDSKGGLFFRCSLYSHLIRAYCASVGSCLASHRRMCSFI